MSSKHQPPRLDQNFMDMMNPVKTFDVMELKVHARSLTVQDFAELKTFFPDWQSFDVADLMNSGNSFEVYATVIWLGVRQDTPELAEKENVFYAVNLNTLSDWSPVLEYVSGVRFDPDTQSETSTEQPPNSEGNGS